MALQPPSKTPAIPAEIWMHVAQFIPHTDLCSMFSINGVFFQLSMNARYRELRVSIYPDAEALGRLQRVRDPSIAHRVRYLYIYLEHRKFLRSFNEDRNLNPGWTGISLLEEIQIMTETVTCLTNVTEFSVEWIDSSPIDHLVPFLTEAWKAFGSRLRKLSFEVSLKGLAALVSAADGLVSLRDLDVTVVDLELVDTRGEALATALAPFVNKVAPTLHSFSYCSSLNDVDPSPFFHRLENAPNLERLRILVNNYVKILTEPCGVTRFIRNHATTLRYLDWDQGYGPSAEQRLMNLLRGSYLEGIFSNLWTLRMRVPRSPGGFSLVIQHIKSGADALTSLGLDDYAMTYEEVNAVVSLFTPHSGRNLKELSLWIKLLSPEHILLIAQALPHLTKLVINATDITGDSVGSSVPMVYSADGSQNTQSLKNFFSIAGTFADKMRTYDICGWALRDIDIQVAAWSSYQAMLLMWVFAECVPSVQRFCRQDKDSEFCKVNPDDRL